MLSIRDALYSQVWHKIVSHNIKRTETRFFYMPYMIKLSFFCIDENKKRTHRPFSSWSIFCTVLNVNFWWKYMWLQALPNPMVLACNKKWNEMQNTQKSFLVSRFLIRVARPAPFHTRILQSCKISWNIPWKSPTFDVCLCSLNCVFWAPYARISMAEVVKFVSPIATPLPDWFLCHRRK